MIRRPPRSTLFPYTTLFRSKTNAAASLFPVSPTGVTGNVLLRLVNAGLRMHVPSIVGSLTTPPIVPTGTVAAAVPGFSLVAEDGNPLPGVSRVQSEVFMAAGKTYDVMINTPAAGGTGLPIFDRQGSLSGNATSRDAGMLAYISEVALPDRLPWRSNMGRPVPPEIGRAHV